MTRLYILLKDTKQWGGLYPSDDLLTARQYLKLPPVKGDDKVQVLNLTGSYRYLGEGYYCSLLAEARGHRVLPSVATLNDLASRGLYGPEVKTIKAPKEADLTFRIFFGRTLNPDFAELGLQLFDRFPAPILEASLKDGIITKLKPKGLSNLTDEEETLFAEALDAFSHKIWRVKKPKRKYRFDLAMLVDPEEKLPPSDTGALKRFIRAGRTLGVQVDLITHKQAARLAEYDGLFIRETTSIHGPSFQMARRAENLGLAVIDTPEAILRCTNKIYLAERMEQAKVAIPKTRVVQRGDDDALEAAAADLGFPLVMKIPDGAFSRGVVKAQSLEDVRKHAAGFFKQSAMILLQEYCYTEFDWRVGVLNKEPLFVSKYFMSRGHWQIYNHSGKKTQSGGFETLPVAAAPKKVVETAVKAANLMGDSLFGVDLKVVDGKPVVIEVNDNPNVDSGVEDKVLGDQLYLTIMQELVKRMS